MLCAAKDSWDEALLREAIAECDKPQYNGAPYTCALEAECRDSLKKVIFLNTQCDRAVEYCVEEHVQAVVRR